MSHAIEIQNDGGYPVDEARLRAAVLEVLARHKVSSETALTIVITADAAVAALNRQFRGVDAPTDVLSFPADEPPVAIPGEPPYLGDLVIAYPYSSAQAASLGHDVNDNLALLVAHGALHLLGYDHDTAANRAEMWAAQEQVLSALGIPADVLPALEGKAHDGA